MGSGVENGFSCVYSTVSSTKRCILLLKTWFTKFNALKTQAVRDCNGCSAAGRDVLAVLPTGYGKTLTGLPVAAKHFGIFVPWWKTRVYHNCCLAVFVPDGGLAFGFEEENLGLSSAIVTSLSDSGERADENLTIFDGMAEADLRAGRRVQASCLHNKAGSSCKQQSLQGTTAF